MAKKPEGTFLTSCGAGTCSPAPVFIGPPPARCRGADSRARRGTGDWYRPTLKWDTLPNCHCEGASRPWQSHAPTSEFAEVALLSTRVLRDCHVGLRPPRNDTSGEHGTGNGALHRISRPIAASRTGLAVPDPTVTSLPIQTCKKIGSRLRPRPGSGCLFKKGRKKRESIGKLILQRSAAEAEAPREAVAAALLLLLALILLLALLRIA